MARTTPRPPPTATRTLQPLGRHCPRCGETMWAAYHNYRTITTLDDVFHLTLQIRRCLNRACPPFRRPYRPEAEGRLALPQHEFGLDVVAWVGTLRYAQPRSLPAIHQHLLPRGVAVAPRTVTHLLERDDELLTLALTDTARLQRITQAQGRVILALDGQQLPGNLSRKGFVPLRGSPRRVTEDVHIFGVVYCWSPSDADPHTALSR